MSELILTRTPEQCRSHHQKYEKSSGEKYEKLLEIVKDKIEKLKETNEEEVPNEIHDRSQVSPKPKALNKSLKEKKNPEKVEQKRVSHKRKYEIWSCVRVFVDIDHVGSW